jgi:predicted acetyltransferase
MATDDVPAAPSARVPRTEIPDAATDGPVARPVARPGSVSPVAVIPVSAGPASDGPVSDGRTVSVVPLTPEDQDALLDLDQWAFGLDDEDIDPEPATATFEWDRAFGVRAGDGRDLAAVHLTYSLDLSVPGGQLPCAGLTWVGVHPQSRRRGLLRAMIDRHLQHVHERGEPVSALYAAEAGIYGRFGYGLASRHQRFTLPRGARLRDVPGWRDVRLRMEKVDLDRHTDLVSDCHEVVRRERPGMVSRRSAGLRREHLSDPRAFRKGGESLRILVAESDDGGPVRGYALFRRKASWGDAGPDGTVSVRECVARDPAAARALWGCLVDLDLTARVETWDQPLDDPLVHLLVDVRSAVPKLVDGLWLRIVDVPAALAGRRYTRDVDLVLGVRDPSCGWNDGTWRLKGGPDGAVCEPASASADLELDVRDLGAVYLGGATFSALAASGLVTEHRASAVPEAAAAFAWPVAPYNSWMF